MTISFSGFFTKAGKFFNAGNTANSSATSIKAEIEDALQSVTATDPIEQYEAIDGAAAAVTQVNSALASANSVAVQTPVRQLLVEIADADNPLPARNAATAIGELITQMEANSSSVDASTPAATPSYGGSNAGDGKAIVSVKRPDGKTNEHILGEDIEFSHNGTNWNYAGEESQRDKMHPEWPKGSGITGVLTSQTAASSGNLLNGDFETEDSSASDLPSGWIASPATLGTTLVMTPVEVQTVVVSGSPSSGYYILTFTDRDSNVQSTAPLAYNASESAVQTALRALDGLASVTVATAGTTPNFTHTITFTGVPNPGQLTSTVSFERNEQQTATVTGSPTGGTFTLTFDGQTTGTIAYNASAATVESALEALSNITDVTVTGSAGGPWTVEFVDPGLQNVAEMTADGSGLTGGTTPDVAIATTVGGRGIVHATTTAGINVAQGARCVEFNSDGSELTALYYPISPAKETQYGVSLLNRVDSAPAAGVVTVDLVDGIGGSVIADEAGTNNSFTIDVTALTSTWSSSTGVFRTPKTLPATVYFRIRITTAITNTSSMFIDEALMSPLTKLYNGGLYAMIASGRTAWEEDDTITIAVTNDRAGAIHEWMHRVFDLGGNDLLLPSDSGGSETIADSLIA